MTTLNPNGQAVCRNSARWPGDLPGSHSVAARFAVLIVAAGIRSGAERTGVPAFTVTWRQAEAIAREAGYVDSEFGALPQGWIGPSGSGACLERMSTTQRQPPLKVGIPMRQFAAAHEVCAGLEVLPLPLKDYWLGLP